MRQDAQTKEEENTSKRNMINREIIRNKVVQLTYAYYQNGITNGIDTAERELLFSLSKAYDLYNYLLELIVAVTAESRRHLEVAQAKARREGVPEPSQKFAYNRFAMQLEENKMLNDFVETQKKTWDGNSDFVRKLYSQITASQIYKDYMSDGEDSYEADRELWRKLYRTLIQENEDLDAVLEEQSLYWNDDKGIVDTFVLKTIKRFTEKSNSKQELLPEYDSEDDKDFARKLFRAAIMNSDEYQRYMSEASRNWDFSRLAYMDVVIMQIALAEILTFPSIPVSVSINEYVDLAKQYSNAAQRKLYQRYARRNSAPPRKHGTASEAHGRAQASARAERGGTKPGVRRAEHCGRGAARERQR